MPRRVTNIIKNGKKNDNKDIFDFSEEIVIGINNKKIVDKNKKEFIKKNKKGFNNSNNKKIEKDNVNKKENLNKKHNKKNNNKTITDNNIVKKNNRKSFDKVRNKSDKQRNTNLKNSMFVKILIIIFIFLVLIIALLLSPLFKVKNITVVGNNQVSSAEIINLSGIEIGENIFKYINYNLMNNIKENAYIDEVKITREYPSDIVISVTERELMFDIKSGATHIYIDGQGNIVDVKNDDLKLIKIKGLEMPIKEMHPGTRLIENDLENLEILVNIYDYAKKNNILDKIIEFEFDKKRGQLIIKLSDNKKAYLENFTNLNIKIQYLKNILERTDGISGEIFLDGQGQNQSIFREEV